MLALAMVEAMWLCRQLTKLQIMAFPLTCSVALGLLTTWPLCDLGGYPWPSRCSEHNRGDMEQRPAKDDYLVWHIR